MATAYKTPGVYVEEIPKLPPSIAQVETAIPAFIGYTQKAKKKQDDDLVLKPIEIKSFLEYQNYFGGPEAETTIGVSVVNPDQPDEEVVVTPPTTPSPFKMYYQLQMYFANGGGNCFIVSVGTYTSARTHNNVAPVILQETANSGFKGLKDGLDKIATEDKPTLLLFPDAPSLISDADFHSIYNSALMQCRKLMDRFTIIDTYSDEEYNNGLSDVMPADAIRNGISLDKDHLKYGAVYYPYLDTVLDYAYDETAIAVSGLNTSLSILAQTTIDSIDISEFTDLLEALVDAKLAIENSADDETALTHKNNAMIRLDNVIKYLKDVTVAINYLIDQSIASDEASLNEPAGTSLVDAMTTWMDTNLEQHIGNLLSKAYKLSQDDTKAKMQGTMASNAVNVYSTLGLTDDGSAMTVATFRDELDDQKNTAANELFDLKTAIDALGAVTVPRLADIKTTNNALYNKIKAEISLMPLKLPPSASMAGIYARVDASRGVWKAPANTGVTYVVKPSVFISHEDQMELNVDTLAGKSINAIRSFTGKGTMVWGARTLAGNDNEWRYISVRRFFNMVEESCKKSTEPFVFEPNDANTWIKVQTMIENYLTNLWRQGALQGTKPEHAFYVAVGLGKTMSANDILEGRMIVEIGMAVVRPAEFIVLEFSHKLPES